MWNYNKFAIPNLFFQPSIASCSLIREVIVIDNAKDLVERSSDSREESAEVAPCATRKRRGKKRVGRQSFANRKKRLLGEVEIEKERLLEETEIEKGRLLARTEEVVKEKEKLAIEKAALEAKHDKLKCMYYNERQEKLNLLWVARGAVLNKE
jgi:hypothetical protein